MVVPRTDTAFMGLQFKRLRPFGVELVGLDTLSDASDPMHDDLWGSFRKTLVDLIEREGLVLCVTDTGVENYRGVRGRSSRGRLSQGEYYHHDGCTSALKPQVVEIRCPYQPVLRGVPTAVAPFKAVVNAMLRVIPLGRLQDRLLQSAKEKSHCGAELDETLAFEVQGRLNRLVVRQYSAQSARALMSEVDVEAEAYRAPWRLGESRFIANRTLMQHRRAYRSQPKKGDEHGHLLKRWPAEEYMGWARAMEG